MTDDTRRMASMRILTGGRTAEERNGAMPTDDIDKLTGPELSAAVAREVMGWNQDDELDHRNQVHWRDHDGERICSSSRWNPHTDRNDAHRVLMRCEEMGDQTVWMVWSFVSRHIKNVVASGIHPLDWKLLTIDPAIICRAALRAVRESR